MADITFKIIKHIGKVGEPSSAGWQTEVNLVSWNGKEPKIDIRQWSPDHARMGKGLTFTEDEIQDLSVVLFEMGQKKAKSQKKSKEVA